MKFCIQHSYNLYWCFIYICNHENSVPSRLSNSCTWSCSWATIDHLPKCMSCHKAIAVITGTAHCFHDCKYITPILFLSRTWRPLILCYCVNIWYKNNNSKTYFSASITNATAPLFKSNIIGVFQLRTLKLKLWILIAGWWQITT